jgi:hypothetical protein
MLLGLGMLPLLVGGALGAAALLVRHEPEAYRHAAVPDSDVRQVKSREFQGELSQAYNQIQGEQAWQAVFTQGQINSYFAEDFVRSGVDGRMLPDGISAPRVAIEAERLRLAFRYGRGFWSAVVSINLRLWLTRESNVLAVELEGLRAGSLPLGAQALMEGVREVAQRNNVHVRWYRRQGNPVALVRFQADRPDRPTVQLKWLELHPGKIVLGGRSQGDFAPRAMLDPAARVPAGN